MLFFEFLERQPHAGQLVFLDARVGLLLGDSHSRHEPSLLADVYFAERRLNGPGRGQVNTLIVTRWNIHRTRAYHRVAELYWGVLGLPVPEGSRPLGALSRFCSGCMMTSCTSSSLVFPTSNPSGEMRSHSKSQGFPFMWLSTRV